MLSLDFAAIPYGLGLIIVAFVALLLGVDLWRRMQPTSWVVLLPLFGSSHRTSSRQLNTEIFVWDSLVSRTCLNASSAVCVTRLCQCCLASSHPWYFHPKPLVVYFSLPRFLAAAVTLLVGVWTCIFRSSYSRQYESLFNVKDRLLTPIAIYKPKLTLIQKYGMRKLG